MKNVVASHQPTFASYPMLFARAAMADVMDFSGSYDQVGTGSDSFNHRVKIGDSENNTWLKAPVNKFKTEVNFWDIPINQDLHKQVIDQLYGFHSANKKKFPLLDSKLPVIVEILNRGKNYTSMATYNTAVFQEFCEYLGIKTKIKLGYEAKPHLNVSEKIAYQMNRNSADVYLSGDNGISYLNPIPFLENDISIIYTSQMADYLEAHKFFKSNDLHTTSIISSVFRIPEDELKDVFSRILKISEQL